MLPIEDVDPPRKTMDGAEEIGHQRQGTVGPMVLTVGTPSEQARCNGPVLLTTIALQVANKSISSVIDGLVM
jgi:hypothetical protein